MGKPGVPSHVQPENEKFIHAARLNPLAQE